LVSSEFVLDASAFYTGVPFLSNSKFYTTNSVFEEVKHIKRSYGALEALIDAGKLKVIEPEELFLQQVISIAKKTGDFSRCSSADLSILALALQLKTTLISDDYAVGNIATLLKIPIKSIGAKGITEIRKWIAFCRACGKAYEPNITECALCGNKLRHRSKKSFGMKMK
jgi:endoribonuclease Nob1